MGPHPCRAPSGRGLLLPAPTGRRTETHSTTLPTFRLPRCRSGSLGLATADLIEQNDNVQYHLQTPGSSQAVHTHVVGTLTAPGTVLGAKNWEGTRGACPHGANAGRQRWVTINRCSHVLSRARAELLSSWSASLDAAPSPPTPTCCPVPPRAVPTQRRGFVTLRLHEAINSIFPVL